MSLVRSDKKCGNSGIPDNAKCSKQTSSGQPSYPTIGVSNNRKNVAKLGLGLVGLSLAGTALGSVVGGRKPPTAPKKPKMVTGSPFTSAARRAPTIPPKKETSITRRLAEIRRKNKSNPGRPEIRDLRAAGLKAERRVQKGSSVAQALSKSVDPKLMKRKKKRDLGSFYKDGNKKTGYVRDRLAKIMDGMRKPKY